MLEVVKIRKILSRQVERVLYVDDVPPSERLLGNQISHILRLQAQLIDCLPAIDISSGFDCDDVGILVENFVKNGASVLAVGILVKVQFNEVPQL